MQICDYCNKPIQEKIQFITILSESMDFNKPMLQIHNSCAYDVRRELDNIIKKVERRMENPEE
jgi:hypothetical protein